MELLQMHQKAGIVTVILNRPEKRNAMNIKLLRELINAAQQIKKDRQIRCVILTGAAQVFSSGIDLNDLTRKDTYASTLWQLLKPHPSLFQQACLIWQTLPVPVIAVLEGFCFGAGLQLALAADMRIASSNTQLSIMESRWGLVPDMGLSHTLHGLLSPDLAKELTFTGRIFNANYAKEIGLVSHVEDNPLEAAHLLADEISQRSPDAVLAAKRVLNAMQPQSKYTLFLEKYWQLKLLLGKNSRIAMQRKKQPEIEFLLRQYK